MNPVASKIREWRANPIKFVEENFHAKPDHWQAEALIAFADTTDKRNERIALKACVGPGKSTVLAWSMLNFLLCYGDVGNHPKAAALSITEDNLRTNLWVEYAKWMQRSSLLSRMFVHTRERLFAKDHPADWFVVARSFPQKADKATLGRTLSGIHSDFTYFQIDEAGEMPVEILQAAEQAMSTGKWCKIMMAGNPMSVDGALYQAAEKQKHNWRVITITGDPDNPLRSSRIKMEFAKEQIALWGRENPWVMFSILGEFPLQSVNKLLGEDDVKAAMSREIFKDAYCNSDKRIGVDVARFGDDRTVIFNRQGLAWGSPKIMRNARTNEIADQIVHMDYTYQADQIAVDDTGGWGAGVIDQLLLMGKSPLSINFSSKAIDTEHFYNRRAEMWWNMAEAIKRGAVLPAMPELTKELTSASYVIDKGKIRLEEKAQVKMRLGVSPDLGDAAALMYCTPDAPRRNYGRAVSGHADTEYDVLGDVRDFYGR